MNKTLLTDLYELTMMQVYFNDESNKDVTAIFDVFFRKNPDEAGFSIFAGLESVVRYIENLRFSDEDIDYLRSLNKFSDGFLDYLREFKFECDVWSVKEGTVIFPKEPLLTVRGPILQVQLVETAILNYINHQSRIATKAERIVRAANYDSVLEFGLRRAHGADAGIQGARSSYIGGMVATSNVLAAKEYNMIASGTMAHSFVMSCDTEYEAFKKYALAYPDDTVLLVDTYDTLKSGVPNAIKVAKEILEPKGYKLKAIRLDSGDLAYLSKKAREILDKEGLDYVKIAASNSLDEYLIKSLKSEGAKIDIWGIGERNITAKSDPVFGGVYKLSQIECKDGEIIPKIKLSDNVNKISNPCFKKVYRLYDNDSNKAIGDVICLKDEIIDEEQSYILFDEKDIWKKKKAENYYIRELQEKIFDKGELVYELPELNDIKEYCKKEVDTLWDEVKRFNNPHKYYVDLSQKLWDIKSNLLQKYSKMKG